MVSGTCCKLGGRDQTTVIGSSISGIYSVWVLRHKIRWVCAQILGCWMSSSVFTMNQQNCYLFSEPLAYYWTCAFKDGYLLWRCDILPNRMILGCTRQFRSVLATAASFRWFNSLLKQWQAAAYRSGQYKYFASVSQNQRLPVPSRRGHPYPPLARLAVWLHLPASCPPRGVATHTRLLPASRRGHSMPLFFFPRFICPPSAPLRLVFCIVAFFGRIAEFGIHSYVFFWIGTEQKLWRPARQFSHLTQIGRHSGDSFWLFMHQFWAGWRLRWWWAQNVRSSCPSSAKRIPPRSRKVTNSFWWLKTSFSRKQMPFQTHPVTLIWPCIGIIVYTIMSPHLFICVQNVPYFAHIFPSFCSLCPIICPYFPSSL